MTGRGLIQHRVLDMLGRMEPTPGTLRFDTGPTRGECVECAQPIMRHSYPAPHGPWLHTDGVSRDHNARPVTA